MELFSTRGNKFTDALTREDLLPLNQHSRALVVFPLVPSRGDLYFAFSDETALHDVMQVRQDYITMICRLERDCSETSGTSL